MENTQRNAQQAQQAQHGYNHVLANQAWVRANQGRHPAHFTPAQHPASFHAAQLAAEAQAAAHAYSPAQTFAANTAYSPLYAAQAFGPAQAFAAQTAYNPFYAAQAYSPAQTFTAQTTYSPFCTAHAHTAHAADEFSFAAQQAAALLAQQQWAQHSQIPVGSFAPASANYFAQNQLGTWAPVVNVIETNDAYLVNAEISGVREEDVEIYVQNNVVTIRGQKQLLASEQQNALQSAERVYGPFTRTVVLAAPVQAGKVRAQLQFGVLEIELPKISQQENGVQRIKIAKK